MLVRSALQLNEEENEEWSEEYAAFGPGPGIGKLVVHLEDGVLYQALEGEADGQRVPRGLSNLARMCRKELKSSGEAKPHGACARYADFLGIGKAVSKAAKWVAKAVKSAVNWYMRRTSVSAEAGRARSAYKMARAVYPTAKETWGVMHCAYELVKQYGAGCGDP